MIIHTAFGVAIILALVFTVLSIRSLLKNRAVWSAVLGVVAVCGMCAAVMLTPVFRECLTPSACNWDERIAKLRHDSVVLDASGEVLGGMRRYPWMQGTDLSSVLVKVLVESEDRRFYRHWGVSLTGLARAIYQNGRSMVTGGSPSSARQGGSTIDMQVLSQLMSASVLGSENTGRRKLTRKFREAIAALDLRAQVGSGAVLELYANTVPLKRATGLPEISAVYMGCTPDKIALAQAATIVAAVAAPNERDPFSQPIAARVARNRLLYAFEHRDPANSLKYRRAMTDSLVSHCTKPPRTFAVRDVQVALREGFRKGEILPETIHTTIDARLQISLQKIVDKLATDIEVNAPRARIRNNPVQAVGIVLDSSGEIRAMICGRSDIAWSFNRCRTPLPLNSVAKAFSIAELVKQQLITPGALFQQVQKSAGFPERKDKYIRSQCSSEKPRPLQNVATLVAVSNNCLALHAYILLDKAAFADLKLLGVPIRPNTLPDALGVGTMPLLGLAAAFGSLASGHLKQPAVLRTGEAAASEMIWGADARDSIQAILGTVVQRGTAKGIEAALGAGSRAFAKTGTDGANSRVTLVGYLPAAHATILLWAGRDQREPILPPHGVNAGDVLSIPWAQVAKAIQAEPRAAAVGGNK